MTESQTKTLVSPATTAQLDFGQQAADYQQILADEAAAQNAINEAQAAAKAVLKKHGLPVSMFGAEASAIKIYKPESAKRTDDIAVVGAMAQYEVEQVFDELDSKSMAALIRLIGDGNVKILQEIGDYQESSNNKEIDEEKTATARAEYEKALEAIDAAKVVYLDAVQRRQNARDYVAYIKDIASIATSAKGLKEQA